MIFSEFKKQLFTDLWETCTERYYVYESDDPKNIDNVQDKINSLIDSIQVVEDNLSEEELDKLMDSLVPFISKSQYDNLDQEDLEYFGETFWYELTKWANKDGFWYDREKGGIYDDNDEEGLYGK
jgi:hypothetical protein